MASFLGGFALFFFLCLFPPLPPPLLNSHHPSKHLKHENPTFSPTFSLILEKVSDYFSVDIYATRMNFYRDGSDWKPFHHDSHAYGGPNSYNFILFYFILFYFILFYFIFVYLFIINFIFFLDF